MPAADTQAGVVSPAQVHVPDGPWSWHRNPMHNQAGATVGFRLGGAADRGIGALCSVSLPPSIRSNGGGTIAVDVAISSDARMSAVALGEQLRNAIALVAIDLLDVLEPLLPSGAEVASVDLRLTASTDTGHGFRRNNSMESCVDWSPLGHPTRPLSTTMGVGVTVDQALAVGDLTDLAVRALERMTIDAGFEDPGDAVADLRRGLAHLSSQQPDTDPLAS